MITASWRALGTSVVVGVTAPVSLDPACAAVAAEVEALDLACSRFRADSDLTRLNAAAGAPVVVSPLLAEAVLVALRAARLTDGDVDPTVGGHLAALGYDRDFADIAESAAGNRAPAGPVPGWQTVQAAGVPLVVTLAAGTQLDLGATAKALGADRAAAAAASACHGGVIVSLGGDVATAGEAPAGGWPVRVTDDHNAPAGVAAQHITIRSGGLATSSSTVRRWHRGGEELHHIIDPRSGRPAVSPYRTVSVAAATCVDANIASTAALIRGDGAADWLRGLQLPARLVTQSGHVSVVNGWPMPAELAA